MDLKIYPHMRKKFEELARETNEFADRLIRAKRDMGEEEYDQCGLAVDKMISMLHGIDMDKLKQYEK